MSATAASGAVLITHTVENFREPEAILYVPDRSGTDDGCFSDSRAGCGARRRAGS